MGVFPTEYIPFTLEQREKAAATDLEEFLRRRGEKLLPAGRDKRLANDHSVTIRGIPRHGHLHSTGCLRICANPEVSPPLWWLPLSGRD